MTTTDDDAFERFERWATDRGVRFATACLVARRDATRGRWIECVDDRAAVGETLLVVPKTVCLSTNTSALGRANGGKAREALRAMGALGLVACVARERALGGESSFAEYMATLPWRQTTTALPGNADPASDVRVVLRGTSVEVMIETDEEVLASDRETVVEFYANEVDGDAAPPTPEEFREAAAVVASRAFFIDDDAGQGLVPYADLFNHKGSGEAHFVVRGCEETEEALRLESTRAMRRGEEVFNSFGDDHDNSLLLYKYGFVERDNGVKASRFDAPRVFALERLRRGETGDAGDDAGDFVSECGVFSALSTRLLDSYEGLNFEIEEDGSLSRGLLALLRCASLDEDTLGAYLEWDDDEEEEEDEPPSAVDSLVERTMIGGEPDRDVWNDINVDVFVTMMLARFLRFIDADEEPLTNEDERAALFGGDVASLIKAIGAQIKKSYEYLDEHGDLVAFGEGLIGLPAAHLVRAHELELLLKALLRRLSSNDDDDDDDDDDEAHHPKRRLVASSLYHPSVYITSKR